MCVLQLRAWRLLCAAQSINYPSRFQFTWSTWSKPPPAQAPRTLSGARSKQPPSHTCVWLSHFGIFYSSYADVHLVSDCRPLRPPLMTMAWAHKRIAYRTIPTPTPTLRTSWRANFVSTSTSTSASTSSARFLILPAPGESPRGCCMSASTLQVW